ncbi:hypothetical protein BH10BAC3_BH10BAC3_24660 [soil metagenome]
MSATYIEDQNFDELDFAINTLPAAEYENREFNNCNFSNFVFSAFVFTESLFCSLQF